jgi:arylsulfatase A-like enzyme/Tfp pilus assembly protein PilF
MRPALKIGGVLWVAAVLPLASEAKTAKTARPGRPNVVLITLDTTRADRMGFLGASRGLTPNLDALAREAAVFTRAYAQVPLTSPSHAGMLTGTYPQFNHVNYLGDPLGDSLPYLPAILKKEGYKTAAFVASLVLDPKKLAPGFDRGFDLYDAGFQRKLAGQDAYQTMERRGEEVVRRALAWVGHQKTGPFFLWVHLYDPHDPYAPPAPFNERFRAEPYDGEIAYTDSMVGKLIAALKARGQYENSVITVAADHGEAFGEHGENHHGIFLYDETIHVPLLIKLPAQRPGQRVDSNVALVDVAPSILDALRLPVPDAMQGKSLVSSINGGNPAPRAIYSESGYGHLSFDWSVLRSWRTGNYLFVDAPERELYDQKADPGAKKNLAPESKAVLETAAVQMAQFRRETSAEAGKKTVLTAEQRDSLHALGYIGSESASPSSVPEKAGTDPKTKIAVANLLYQAMALTENARYEEAVPILEEVIRQEPNAVTAYLQLGRAYVFLREFQKAVAPLQRVVESTPENALARYELGCALVKTGHWAEAAPHFEAAVSQMNSSAMMHFYLAMVYQQTSRSDEALAEFRSALRLDPQNFPANLLLGRLFVQRQKPADALPYLKKAATLRPDAADPHRLLADAYTGMGDGANADREISEAQRILSQGGSRMGTPTNDPQSGVAQP